MSQTAPLRDLLLGAPDVGLRMRLANALGMLGIASLALGFALATGPVNAGLGLMLLALMLQWPEAWARLKREPFFWATLLLVTYLFSLAAWAATQYPSGDINLQKGLQQLIGISGLLAILVAWSLQGDGRRIALALLLAGLSLLIAIAEHSSLEQILAYLDGQRATYGLANNGPGLYMSAGLLALGTLGVVAVDQLRRDRPALRAAGWLLLLVVAFVFAIAVVFNQSRSSWLAAALVLPPGLALAAYLHRRRGRLRFGLRLGLALAVLIGAGAYLGTDVIQERLGHERKTIEAIKEGDLANVPASSIGSRVHMWRGALEYIQERPVFGWGPGTSRMLIRQLPGIKPLPHFHNLYLNLLVEVGVMGLALFALTFGVLARDVLKAYRQRFMSAELTLFVTSVAAMFLLASMAQIRHDDAHGMSFLALLTGLAYTRWLWRVRVPLDEGVAAR